MTETKKRSYEQDEPDTTNEQENKVEESTTGKVEEKEIKKAKVEDKKEEEKKDEEKKEEEEKKTEEAPKLSIFNTSASSPWTFSSFSSTPSDPSKPFGGTTTFGSSFSSTPFTFNLTSTSSFSKSSTSDESSETKGDGEEKSTLEEDFSSSATYVPVLQNLAPVETVTGEENETTICSAKGKLYVLSDSSYKERGIGLLKLNKANDTGASRLILNVDGSKRSALNVSVFANMKVDIPSEKSLRFTAFEEGKFITFLTNMKKPEEVQTFEKNITKQIEIIKSKEAENPVPPTAAADEKKQEKVEKEEEEEKEKKENENGKESNSPTKA